MTKLKVACDPPEKTETKYAALYRGGEKTVAFAYRYDEFHSLRMCLPFSRIFLSRPLKFV